MKEIHQLPMANVQSQQIQQIGQLRYQSDYGYTWLLIPKI